MAGDLVIPEGFGEATLKWSVEGRLNPISCTIGFAKSSDSDDLGDVMNNMMSQLTETGSLCAPAAMVTIFTFLGVSCIYNNAGTMVGAESDHPAVVGTVSSADPMIIGNTLIIQKKTGLVGKQFRGRLYFPIMYGGEGNVDYLGNIDPSILPVIAGKLSDWVSAFQDDTSLWIPNLLHHPPKEGVTPVPTPISSMVLTGRVGTQRRRLR